MSRAAIVPVPGDPFLLYYWLCLFHKHWKDEVDNLYVYFNSPIEKPVVDYVRKICAYDKIILLYNPLQIEHGEAINRTLDVVKEDLVMLVEDDGFIFKPGIVDICFKLIEDGKYDIVGSKRGSCSMEIWDRSKSVYGLNYDGLGDQGPNFWPCFFFSKKDLLTNFTDRNFGAKMWNPGDIIHELNDYVVKEPCANDTFVWVSIQLLHHIPQNRIKYLPQYHTHPDDVKHFENKENVFDGVAPWCHIGSLSSGIGGLLTDNENRPLSRRLIDPPRAEIPLDHKLSEMEIKEYERRVQFWFRFYTYRQCFELKEFEILYYQALLKLVSRFGLHWKQINKRLEIYRTLGL